MNKISRQARKRRVKKKLQKDVILGGIAICNCSLIPGFNPSFKPDHEQRPTEREASDGNSNIEEHHDV